MASHQAGERRPLRGAVGGLPEFTLFPVSFILDDTVFLSHIQRLMSNATPVPASPPAIDRTLAGIIDHTLLKPEGTVADIERLCAEAKEYGFASVCIQPLHVPLASRLLRGSGVRVCTVIGFPLGSNRTSVKAHEADQALLDGAQELDMVISVGMLKTGDTAYVEQDVRAVVEAAHRAGGLTKAIIEAALLSDEEKETACRLAVSAGAEYVKTSTGFSRGGATPADVALMRRVVGPAIGVKAAGGIRTREDALTMIRSGATRIGASASIQIVTLDNQQAKR